MSGYMLMVLALMMLVASCFDFDEFVVAIES